MINEIAIESSKRYYKYLTDKSYGYVVIKVVKIEPHSKNTYKLFLDSSLRVPESVQIRVGRTIYEHNQISPQEYDSKKRILTISLSKEVEDLFPILNKNNVEVISDLRFLVKRVEEWYKKYGEKLTLNRTKPFTSSNLSESETALSKEQIYAITTVLSEPFSYIWGAPGTGKTRFVLSRCILNYVNKGEKLLIAAPTNNALEQTLYGLLPVLEEAGFNPSKYVLRLGTSSTEFSEAYPEICESRTTSKALSAISDSTLILNNQLDEINSQIDLYPAYMEFIEFMEKWETCKATLPNLFVILKDLYIKNKDAQSSLRIYKAKLFRLESELEINDIDKAQLGKQIDKTLSLATKYKSGIRRLLFPKQYVKYNEELKTLTYTLDEKQEIANRLKNDVYATKEVIKETEKLISDYSEQSYQYHITIRKTTEFWKELSKRISELEFKDFDNIVNILNDFFNKYQSRISDGYKKYECITRTIDELHEEKEIITSKLNELHEKSETLHKSVSDNMHNRTILAATIDTLLNRILPDGDFKPKHIFLDEAGYCCLIKAATLTAFDCPITFLGDHMQLPPVCEMNDEEFENPINMPVFLWAQSALYIEELFSESISSVFNSYINRKQAYFNTIKKIDLTHTYRFSNSLASILASKVYSDNFCGDNDHSTHMYYIHAPKISDCQRRTSPTECSAILKYLKCDDCSDIGIITPYKAQRDLLRQIIPSDMLEPENIITVHGSQGREWNTVILSVVDTADMWFTNSLITKSNGLKLINTAVSRAKKKLIIVCDYNYWQNQHKQLIGNILESCEPLDIETVS